MVWQPSQELIVQLIGLLGDCMSPEPDKRNYAMEAIKSFQLQSEFLNYLCYILIEGNNNSPLKSSYTEMEIQNSRATAGMLLKNTMLNDGALMKNNYSLEYVKENIVHGLHSDNLLVSNVTGIVITTLFSTYYRQQRDDPTGVQMLFKLLELAENGNEASIKAFSKIMEDSAQFLQLIWAGNVKPLDRSLDSLFKFIASPDYNHVIRSESLKCINTVIPLQAQAFSSRIEEFLGILFQLAQNDANDDVRTQICIAFAEILEFRPDKLVDHLNGIIQFVLHLINTVPTEKVAIEACEFLHAFATSTHIPEHVLQPFVKDIVPVLLAKMVYNEESILVLESSNDDDAFLEDKDEDIRPVGPRIMKKKDSNKNSSVISGSNDADDEAEDDDDTDDDTTVDTDWNLRKCSASTIDIMTTIFPRDVMEIAFPYLSEHLMADKWFIREATVLALGAMAEGGMKYFNEQLPALIHFLIEQLKDKWAPVRKIACWTLSRFSVWILRDHTEFLLPVLEPILNTLLDKKKDVQEAAISSLAVYIENCDTELIETLFYSELLTSFDKCFQFYKKRNLIILYDAVGRFAESCQMDESAMQLILPHLINKWSNLPDDDKELWPLLECLSCVACSLGEKFLPMAPDVYSRAFRILHNSLDLEIKARNDPSVITPEKDFIITSLDLIDGLVQGVGSHSQSLLFPHGSQDLTLLKMMLECLNDSTHEVRQSCFALLGDIAYFFDSSILLNVLAEFLKFIGTEIMHNDDIDGTPAVVNAIWCLGLIGERIDLQSYVLDMSRIVLDLFLTDKQILDSSIIENLGVTIGRLSLIHPEVFSQGDFATDSSWNKWTNSVKNLESVEEKSSAYMGFLKVVNIATSSVQTRPETVHNIISGLSTNVDVTVFADEILKFLMAHYNEIQQMNLSPDEMSFLQQFNNA